MGCTSSKRIEATTTAGVYRPLPSSFAVFDINSIQEPWLSIDNSGQENQEKPTHVPAPLLDKLNKLETETPHSWEEVSKALEDLKPTLNNKNLVSQPPGKVTTTVAAVVATTTHEKKQPPPPRKSSSFHTLEELDAKLSSKPKKEMRKIESMRTESTQVLTELTAESGNGMRKLVKENIFILRDKQEREKEGKLAIYEKIRRDPLNDYPEKCPPAGEDSVVIYTTSLRGVRKTYEDCNRVRGLMELHQVVFDERDVSLHGEFLKELRELLGEEEAMVPRVFVKGRYLGGVDELVELNETSRLGRILSSARVERGIGRQACEGCGGARFMPCLDCGGSCKVMVDGIKERCGKCNENGLVLCPTCL